MPAVAQLVAIYRQPFATLERWRAHYGPRFTVRIPGMPPLVFLADPDDARTVFDAPPEALHPGEGSRAIEPIVGDRSFMLADEDEHIAGRALLKDAFATTTAERHLALLSSLAESEIATWPRDEVIELHPRLRAFALRVVLRTIFGADPRVAELAQRLLVLLEVTSSPVLGAPPTRRVRPFRTAWRQFLHQRAAVDWLIFDLIDARRERTRTAEPRDTIQLLLDGPDHQGRPLSREYLRDPDIQARVAEEASAPEPARFLQATIFEVLRHRPVFVFAIPRAVVTPFRLGEETFRAPVHLLPCIYLLHHDPDVYPDPDSFRPERFLANPPDRTQWIPWGGGRKRCPGRHLALAEMETIIRKALINLRVEPATRTVEGPSWRSVIVTPSAGARVTLRAR